ncbi:MAG: helix-turn-helix domain-containing protein [Streptosporangiales bacterium]|nr:helix-turn-helix domain-containing protein [Streptosporangiales bacterium]
MDPVESVCFSYGPLLEAVFSLHVLVEPQRHPLHHPWIRQMRQLPPSLRREIAAHAAVLGASPPGAGTALPDPLGRFPADTSASFHDGLADLRALPAETITAEFAEAPAFAARPEPEHTDSARQMARDDPPAFIERLCRLLEDYWDAAFEKEWLRVEPRLADSVSEAGRLLLTAGLTGFVDTLGPRVRGYPGRRQFDLDVTCAPQWGSAADLQNTEVMVTDTFTFVPSAFSWPHIWYSVDAPWSIGMTYDPSFVTRQARPRIPPTDLVSVLRACGDDVRLRTLRWIAERPRSTQELAPLVGITESSLSKHLHQLTESGVLEPHRDGQYVLYHLRRERLRPLTESLLAYLDPADPEQPPRPVRP